MLNEERVILMTKLASYEAGEGRKNIAVGSYFRSDYIGWQVLKSIISATIAFVVVFGMFIFYDFEGFMSNIYKMDLLQFCRSVLIWYGVVAAGYAAAAYAIYTYRYSRARSSLRLYYKNLRKLSNMYDEKQ